MNTENRIRYGVYNSLKQSWEGVWSTTLGEINLLNPWSSADPISEMKIEYKDKELIIASGTPSNKAREMIVAFVTNIDRKMKLAAI